MPYSRWSRGLFARFDRPRGSAAEADEIAAHLHLAVGTGDPHVATFVQNHRDQDGQREQRDAESRHHRDRETSCGRRASKRVAGALPEEYIAGAASASSTVAGSAAHSPPARDVNGCSRSAGTGSARPGKASAASSLSGVVDRRHASAGLSPAYFQFAAEDGRVSGSNSQVEAGAEVAGDAVASHPVRPSESQQRSAASCPAG